MDIDIIAYISDDFYTRAVNQGEVGTNEPRNGTQHYDKLGKPITVLRFQNTRIVQELKHTHMLILTGNMLIRVQIKITNVFVIKVQINVYSLKNMIVKRIKMKIQAQAAKLELIKNMRLYPSMQMKMCVNSQLKANTQ